jgi:hypothetical protein
MDLLRDTDRKFLARWQLLADYLKYRLELIQISKAAYKAVEKLQVKPEKEDCLDAVIEELLLSKRFDAILASRQHVRYGMYRVFADAMARHLLDKDWAHIQSP